MAGIRLGQQQHECEKVSRAEGSARAPHERIKKETSRNLASVWLWRASDLLHPH